MCRVCATNSERDATGTGALRRKAFAQLRQRLQGALREVRQYVENIPRERISTPNLPVTNARIYKYDLTDRDTNAEIHAIVEAWFGTGADDPPPRWFLGQFVTQSYTSGAAQEAARLQTLVSGTGVLSAVEMSQLDVEAILQTRAFRSRIDRVYRRAFEEMAGFTGETGNDLARTLADGVGRGDGIRTITGEIRDRFEVAETRAQRIARTEIGQSYRDARREATVDARDRLGLRVVVQWISALAPTTRASHAARHLKFYTPEQVAAFYSRDGNAINCLCSEQSVVVQDNGSRLGARSWTKRDRALVDELLAA